MTIDTETTPAAPSAVQTPFQPRARVPWPTGNDGRLVEKARAMAANIRRAERSVSFALTRSATSISRIFHVFADISRIVARSASAENRHLCSPSAGIGDRGKAGAPHGSAALYSRACPY